MSTSLVDSFEALADIEEAEFMRAYRTTSVVATEQSLDWTSWRGMLLALYATFVARSATLGAAVARVYAPRGVAPQDEEIREAIGVATQAHTLAAVERIEASTRLAVRDLIAADIRAGVEAEAARLHASEVAGLDPRSARALRSYRARLMAEYASPSEVAKRAAEYRARAAKARAERIAQSEVVGGQNLGETVFYEQAHVAGQVDSTGLWKVWRLSSANPCRICIALNGQRVRFTESFATLILTASAGRMGFSREVPPIHPNCQCFITVEQHVGAPLVF